MPKGVSNNPTGKNAGRKPGSRNMPEMYKQRLLRGLDDKLDRLEQLCKCGDPKVELGAIQTWIKYTLPQPEQTIKHEGRVEMVRPVLVEKPQKAETPDVG